jgi:hypothetical protein
MARAMDVSCPVDQTGVANIGSPVGPELVLGGVGWLSEGGGLRRPKVAFNSNACEVSALKASRRALI